MDFSVGLETHMEMLFNIDCKNHFYSVPAPSDLGADLYLNMLQPIDVLLLFEYT